RLQDPAVGVAGVEEQWPAVLLRHLQSAAAEIADVLTPCIFLAQAMANLQELVSPRRDAMGGLMRSHLTHAIDRHDVIRRDSYDLNVVLHILQLLVQRHERPKVGCRFGRHEHAPAGHALQIPLAGIERDAQSMIEMGVGNEDVRHPHRQIGPPADIEYQAEVADAKKSLLACARASLYREVLRGQREKVSVHHARRTANARTGKLPTVRILGGTAKKRNGESGN